MRRLTGAVSLVRVRLEGGGRGGRHGLDQFRRFDHAGVFGHVEFAGHKIFGPKGIGGVSDDLGTDEVGRGLTESTTSPDERDEACDESPSGLRVVLKGPAQHAPDSLGFADELTL
jgi:hypothetical protein